MLLTPLAITYNVSDDLVSISLKKIKLKFKSFFGYYLKIITLYLSGNVNFLISLTSTSIWSLFLEFFLS